jgi:RimJ/RimL family protein N-acetyltransferase
MYDVVHDNEDAYGFVNRFFGIGRTEQMRGLCLRRDGATIAAAIYDEYNGQNVFMHLAAEPGRKWLNRHFLHEAFKYPFLTLHAGRITLWVERRNIDCRRFVHHLGFTQEATLERAAPDGTDVVIYRMFREDCRYA